MGQGTVRTSEYPSGYWVRGAEQVEFPVRFLFERAGPEHGGCPRCTDSRILGQGSNQGRGEYQAKYWASGKQDRRNIQQKIWPGGGAARTGEYVAEYGARRAHKNKNKNSGAREPLYPVFSRI